MPRGIREITEPIQLEIVGDRLHFTCISGGERFAFAVSLHKAANAAMCTNALLAQQREAGASKVMPFGR